MHILIFFEEEKDIVHQNDIVMSLIIDLGIFLKCEITNQPLIPGFAAERLVWHWFVRCSLQLESAVPAAHFPIITDLLKINMITN